MLGAAVRYRAGTLWLLLVFLLSSCSRHSQVTSFWGVSSTPKPTTSAGTQAASTGNSVTATIPSSSSASSSFDGKSQQLGSSVRQTAPGESRCPGNCTRYGTCHEELGRCDCLRNRQGSDCSKKLQRRGMQARCRDQGFADVKDCMTNAQLCINHCNKRGKCVAGVCHCKRGHFGADCSLSLGPDGKPVLLAGAGYTTRTKRPWVYVYELPPELATWYNFRRLDRPTHLYLWQRLLSSGARVADGDVADYYFIPIRQRAMSDSSLLTSAISYIQATYPWWNRTGGGHRHFVLQTGDWGRAEMSPAAQVMGENMTWLTHWGLTRNRTDTFFRWTSSYRPERDVVVPVYISPGHFVKFSMIRSPLNPATPAKPRSKATFFFAGRLCYNSKMPNNETWPHCGEKSDWYSGGIREKVFASHWNRSGYHVRKSEKRYGLYMAQSVYCLAPPGAGHGQRQIQALFMGCVPVTIADDVAEPFEPAVSWEDWGVRVAEEEVPRMHQILAAISPQELKLKQSRMLCAAQHMLYSSVTGGLFGEDGRFDAFETILEVLRVRAAHPDAAQRQFRQLDPDFDAFMDCKDPPGFIRLSGIPDPALLAAAEAEAVAEAPEADAAEGTEGGEDGFEDNEDGDDDEADGDAETVGSAGDGDGTEGGAEPSQVGLDGSGGAGGWVAGGGDVGNATATQSSGKRSPPRPPAAPGTPPPLVLCSHSYVDIHNRERSCYYFMRGGGYMGVPGGAICACGFKSRLAQCPRLWG